MYVFGFLGSVADKFGNIGVHSNPFLGLLEHLDRFYALLPPHSDLFRLCKMGSTSLSNSFSLLTSLVNWKASNYSCLMHLMMRKL